MPAGSNVPGRGQTQQVFGLAGAVRKYLASVTFAGAPAAVAAYALPVGGGGGLVDEVWQTGWVDITGSAVAVKFGRNWAKIGLAGPGTGLTVLSPCTFPTVSAGMLVATTSGGAGAIFLSTGAPLLFSINYGARTCSYTSIFTSGASATQAISIAW